MAGSIPSAAAQLVALALCGVLQPVQSFAAAPCARGGESQSLAGSSDLYGFIATNTTLTVASPGPIYNVLGDLVVNPGVTLTIQPGVTLQMASSDILQGGDFPDIVELTIQGTLIADASTGDSIRFLAVGGPGSEWGQIKTIGAGSATLRNVVLSGPKFGVQALSTAMFTIKGSTIRDCFFGIMAGLARVEGCVLVGRGPGVGGQGLTVNSSTVLTPSDSTAPHPTAVSNFGYGVISTPGVTLTNLIVHDNTSGIEAQTGGPVVVNYCTVVRNSIRGINLGSSSNSTVLNSIAAQNNGTYSLGGFYASFSDLWFNGGLYDVVQGPNIAGFNPFFVDPANNDFRLADNSVFKTYSNSAREIGAYGPGPDLTLDVDQPRSRPVTSLRASPNPTRGAAILEFEQAVSGRVTVDVLDILGRRVGRVADEYREAGMHRVVWSGQAEDGGSIPPGLYFWRVSAAGEVRTDRLVVSR